MAIYLSDTFNRTVSNGWGTADGGTDTNKAWVVRNGTAANFSCNGSVAVNDEDWNFTRVQVGDNNSANVEVSARFLNSTAPGQFGDRGLVARYQAGGADYEARIIDATGTVIQLIQRDGGGLTASAAITHFSAFRLKLQVITEGADVRVRARYWQDGQAEPGTWTVEQLHNTGTRFFSGSYGVLMTNNPPTTHQQLDDFLVQDVPVEGRVPLRAYRSPILVPRHLLEA